MDDTRINFSTMLLRTFLESKGPEETFKALQAEETMGVVMVYHLARAADALERIANHLEVGKIETLEGENMVAELRQIARAIGNT